MHEFKLPGLRCMGCYRTILKALKSFDQRIEVDVDLSEKKLFVKTDRSKEEIIKVIEEEGYAPVT